MSDSSPGGRLVRLSATISSPLLSIKRQCFVQSLPDTSHFWKCDFHTTDTLGAYQAASWLIISVQSKMSFTETHDLKNNKG